MENKGEEKTIVLLGYLGSGKSSTGNVITGCRNFETAMSMVAVTKKVQAVRVNSYNTTIVDTPGLETANDFDKFKDDIREIARGKCVYAIVVRTGRYTPEEQEMLQGLFQKNKKIFFENSVMIFTNCKELCNNDNKAAEQTFEKWLSDAPSLRKLMLENNIKYIEFENVQATDEEKKAQVMHLLHIISKGTPKPTKLRESEDKMTRAPKTLSWFQSGKDWISGKKQ